MSSLVVGSSLKEFFRLLLTDAASRHRLALSEIAEHYIVNLLSDFAASEKLFTEELGGGRRDHEPLAILYHRAMQQDREQKIRTLRRLGDISLYKVGFFADSVRESVVGADYYIEMGGSAYGQVASLVPGRSGFGGVFSELCEKFRQVVDVLERIAAQGQVAAGPSGTMRVLESWARSGNGSLEEVLIDAGLLLPKGQLPN